MKQNRKKKESPSKKCKKPAQRRGEERSQINALRMS
jgi:hypothetical protein